MAAVSNILFLCTGNSCRSQMAEGFAGAMLADIVRAYSAGTHPQRLNPLAVRAMAEVGIDISKHFSKSLAEVPTPEVIITVCDSAHESCPVVPGVRVLHVPFEDPPRLANGARSDEDALPHYRRVRDEIAKFVAELRPRLLELNLKEART
ncbi:MAG: arsenate reductase ArsC [Phycisphaeraceae bacterium]|nr:arsenate reductase ArsC [Phycisphaeraceae bacterium]